MHDKADRFFKDIKDKKVFFIGYGVSHCDCVRQFAAKGIDVTLCDKRTREQIGADCDELERLGVKFRLGEDYLQNLDADILFRTPGLYFNNPELTEFRRRGGIVTSEMEVFFDLCPCPVFAVTGSDGKTTTTTLISEMLRESGKTVHLGGNIGRALLPQIEAITPEDVAVVELSSFQLISMRPAPQVAVITNVTPNHLDVHGNMEEYTNAKRNLYAHQNAFSRTVLNADNDVTASFADGVRGRLSCFSLEKPVENGSFLDSEGWLCIAENGAVSKILHRDDIRIPGTHNVANYLAAISAVNDVVGADVICKVAREFGGVEHRIEFVRELDGVKWYNDSIATSPTRAIAGLLSFTQKLILIAGGYDKQIPFEPLCPHLVEHVKLLILTGATADKIEQTLRACPDYADGKPEILHADDIAHAVRLAKEHAKTGDIVSLSPACASFDSFPNFEARGRHFKELVNSL